MVPAVIGLLGRSRSGKDTVANIIMSNYPEYTIVRLSAPLKQAATALYHLTPEQLETDQKEIPDPRWNKTPRQLIQSLTDHVMQNMGHDFFTKRLYDGLQPHQPIIIPDVRFAHDITEIMKHKGIVIKITRPGNPIQHPFENHIDHLTGTHHLINDSTIENLANQISKSSWFG